MQFCVLPVVADYNLWTHEQPNCAFMAKGQSQKPHSGKMDKDNKDDKDGLFGGRFHFKKLPNDSLEKKKV